MDIWEEMDSDRLLLTKSETPWNASELLGSFSLKIYLHAK